MIDVNRLIEGEILSVYKPLQWTSFDVVNKIKSHFKKAQIKLKIGHAGTLDPLAEGLLIICTGKCTKQIEAIQALPKTYEAIFFLGATRPSFDKETEINETFATSHITDDIIQKAKAQLTGEIWQTPPIYSAIKRNGKPVYESARLGIHVELQPRKQIIHQFEITSVEMPLVKAIIDCSKGTYIRSLADDFGKLCQSGAYLDYLKRTKIGEYTADKVLQLSDFENISF